MRRIRKLIVKTVQFANIFLRQLGGEIVPNRKATSLESALRRLKLKNIHFQTVVDVGASDGKWTEVVRRYFPDPQYLLIEAQENHEDSLLAFKQRTPNVDFVLAAAGDSIGEVYFDVSDPYGGVASHSPLAGERKKVVRLPVTTIDVEITNRNLPGPYMIKLDTHGFELPIFAGAETALADTAIIVVEAYNFVIAEGSIRFHEMISFLEERGFRVIDMCDPVYRPGDGVLWQMDLIFARADRAEFGWSHFSQK